MRKIVLTGIAVGVAATTALATSALAQGGQPTQLVTGGGQIIASSSQGSGPGDTIALSAQGLSSQDTSARGQVQYVQHASGTDKWHGTVTCLQVSGSTARIGGTKSTGGFFKIVLDDVDQGAAQTGVDQIYLNENASDDNCTQQDQNEQQTDLGRGNFTVHQQNG